jgi:hypothetical protein
MIEKNHFEDLTSILSLLPPPMPAKQVWSQSRTHAALGSNNTVVLGALISNLSQDWSVFSAWLAIHISAHHYRACRSAFFLTKNGSVHFIRGRREASRRHPRRPATAMPAAPRTKRSRWATGTVRRSWVRMAMNRAEATKRSRLTLPLPGSKPRTSMSSVCAVGRDANVKGMVHAHSILFCPLWESDQQVSDTGVQ